MTEFIHANPDIVQAHSEKVNKAVDFSHPAEVAFREGREAKRAQEAAQIEYERREFHDGSTTYVVEDREDGPYVIARDDGRTLRHFGEEGLFIDNLPEEVMPPPESPEEPQPKKLIQEENRSTMEIFGGVVGAPFEGMLAGLIDFAGNVGRAGVRAPLIKDMIGDEESKEIAETIKTFLEITEMSDQMSLEDKTNVEKALNIGGDVTGQFVIPAVTGFGALRALGAGPIVSSLVTDAGIGAFGVTPEEENIFNMIPEDSEAAAAIKAVFATDPDDSEFENRLRNMTEAVVTLGVGEAAARSLVKSVSASAKVAKTLKEKLPEKAVSELERFLKDEGGSVQIPGKPPTEQISGSKGPSAEQASKAGSLVTEAGQPIVPEQIVKQAREALKKEGKAEGVDFNLARMDTPDQVDNLIDELSEVYKEPIKKRKGGVQTFSETQAKADLEAATGFDIDTVLSRRPGDLWPAHKIKAARDIFVSELNKTNELANAIRDGADTTENMVAFRRQLAVVSGLQAQIKGVQTEVARALSQYRMTAKTPMEAQVNLAEMMQKSGGSEMNKTMVDAYLNAVENGGPEAAAIFARNAEQVTGWDMLYEAWINSLLGSPATHMVNSLGNSLTINQAVIERYVGATYGGIERGVGRFLGKEVGGVTFREANALSQGYALAVNDAMVAFGKALKTGESSDLFGKIDYGSDAITAQNVNQLPISKTISAKLMDGDELIKSNSQLAHMVDYMGEFYYRLPGRFLMAEDEFFKVLNYRAQVHALAAREAAEQGLDKAAQVDRIKHILEEPQLNAPDLHQEALDFAREQTFTAPAGPIARKINEARNAIPAGRVVVPFFNVINNITKYVGARVPGAGAVVPDNRWFTPQVKQDLFSKNPAKRQMVMGKWATGGSLLGFGAWSSMNGICTGRITDNPKMLQTIEKGQNRRRYSCHLPGTDKMMNYNRLEPAGMLMAIAADTANALAYSKDEEEQKNLVMTAVAAVVPYMEDKSFFRGVSEFMDAFNPQFGDDEAKRRALGRYFSNLMSSAPGAVLGPLAPNTPLSRNVTRNMSDDTRRAVEADRWTVERDDFGDPVLVANSETYKTWQRTINKIFSGTPGLSKDLPPAINVWGQDIIFEGGLGPDIMTPIYTNTPTFDVNDLKGKNLPANVESGRFRGARVGADMTVEQHKEFVKVVGIDGELERLNMPLSMPRRAITAQINGKNVGLSVDMNHEDYVSMIKIMNEIKVPNDAHASRKRMNLKETLNWMIKQPEYAKLPDDRDATGAKGDMIRKVFNEYKGAAVELFFQQHPLGQTYFRKSIEMKQRAQNTGVE